MNGQRITFTLNEVVNVLNASADRLLRSKFDLTYSQFLFLVTLAALDKPTASFLAECLGVSRAAVSQRLTWFESRKYIEVSRADGSNKNLSLSLTKEGLALVNNSSEFLENEFRQVFESVASVDLGELNATLMQIKQGLLLNEESRNVA